jgi:hypothetical protein
MHTNVSSRSPSSAQIFRLPQGTGGGQRSINLATFVHVSDMHFGRPPLNDDPSGTSPLAVAIHRMGKGFESGMYGLAGHCYQALAKLDSCMKRNFSDAQLIFTGDLTAYGEEDQFEEGSAYFEGRFRPPGRGAKSEAPIGFHQANWRLSVPGNHDYFCLHLGNASILVRVKCSPQCRG